jgi:hypothetical protein
MSQAEVAKMEGEDYYNNRTREDAKPADVANLKTLLDGSGPAFGRRLQRLLGRSRASHVALVKGEFALVLDRGARERPHPAHRRHSALRPVKLRARRVRRQALLRATEHGAGAPARSIAMRGRRTSALTTIPKRARWASVASSASATPAAR